MISNVPFYMAFGAGIVSFLSPCVLPLIPGYISFISGSALMPKSDENRNDHTSNEYRDHVLLNAFSFVIGFSIVFILLGASATWIGSLLASKMNLLTKISGAIIIFFGFFKTGLIRPFFLFKEAKFDIAEKQSGLIGALFIGAAFAFGWTPCIGPILAGILAYAGTMEHMYQGILLLSIYSLGLGVPFLLTALSLQHFFKFFGNIRKYLGTIEIISGIVMIIFGWLIFTNKLIIVASYFSFLNDLAL